MRIPAGEIFQAPHLENVWASASLAKHTCMVDTQHQSVVPKNHVAMLPNYANPLIASMYTVYIYIAVLDTVKWCLHLLRMNTWNNMEPMNLWAPKITVRVGYNDFSPWSEQSTMCTKQPLDIMMQLIGFQRSLIFKTYLMVDHKLFLLKLAYSYCCGSTMSLSHDSRLAVINLYQPLVTIIKHHEYLNMNLVVIPH